MGDRKLFFFFGSLRKGYWNQRVLSADAKFEGPAETVGDFSLYVGRNSNIPTVIPSDVKGVVRGEVYSLGPEDAHRVERLEAGYLSMETPVRVFDGPEQDLEMARIYYHNSVQDCRYLRGGFDFVPSGDYADVVTPKGTRK